MHCFVPQVLEKVKHENIVKLLAIEEEQEGRGKVSRRGRKSRRRYERVRINGLEEYDSVHLIVDAIQAVTLPTIGLVGRKSKL